MGHVQSGKTTNYAALIAKAIDAGYRQIVVLAGVTNSLREQTQERLDLDVGGRKSRLESIFRMVPIGAGLLSHGKTSTCRTLYGHWERDFKNKMISSEDTYSEPLFLYVRKTRAL